MNPEVPSPNPSAELAFVQQALQAADRSERYFTVSVWTLCCLTLVAFVWMHVHFHAPESLGDLLHMLLRVGAFFVLLLLAIMGYLRRAMNRNTRTILRALANTRQR